MEYKKLYSQEEIQELLTWFKDNEAVLPQSVTLDEAQLIPDLRFTINQFGEMIKCNWKNPNFGAHIHLLFRIRDRVKEAMAE